MARISSKGTSNHALIWFEVSLVIERAFSQTRELIWFDEKISEAVVKPPMQTRLTVVIIITSFVPIFIFSSPFLLWIAVLKSEIYGYFDNNTSLNSILMKIRKENQREFQGKQNSKM